MPLLLLARILWTLLQPGVRLPAAEVIIISTVHQPTARFNDDSLIRILDSLHPDIILLEYDPSFFDSSGTLIKKYRIASMESCAATHYADGKQVLLLPYDIVGRNKFYQSHDYFSWEAAMNHAVDSLWHEHALPSSAMHSYDTLLQLARIRDRLLETSPFEINTSEVDSLMMEKERLGIRELRHIVETTPALEHYRRIAATADSFWTARNTAMIRNIDRIASENPGKRIVAFCGLEHAMRLRWNRRS
jgi:hypothetical protein